jgi:hypothetical protein
MHSVTLQLVATRRIGQQGRRFLRTVHLVTSLGWFGVGLGELGSGIIALSTHNPTTLNRTFDVGGSTGLFLCAPLAVVALLTGLLLGSLTAWGLRRRWIIVKLVLTVIAIVVGSTVLGALSDHVVAQTGASAGVDVGADAATTALFAGAGNLLILLTVTVVSVVKPWERGSQGLGRGPGEATAEQVLTGQGQRSAPSW